MTTITVIANVIDGTIEFNYIPLDYHATQAEAERILTDPTSGTLIGTLFVGPWDEDETGMERADAALEGEGLTRVGPWSGEPGDQYWVSQVTRLSPDWVVLVEDVIDATSVGGRTTDHTATAVIVALVEAGWTPPGAH